MEVIKHKLFLGSFSTEELITGSFVSVSSILAFRTKNSSETEISGYLEKNQMVNLLCHAD
jgi:hypothetical protein